MKQNNYEVTRKKMNKQISQLYEKTNQKPQQQVTVNLKIDNFIKTISKLQSETSQLQQQVDYCKSVSVWIEDCIKRMNYKSANVSLKPLMSASSKLINLQKQSIMFKTNKKMPKVNKQSQNNMNKCNISTHLKYILTDKNERQSKIQQLEETKIQLYAKIKQTLVKQQPYLYQKIMKKIQKQVKRQIKIQTIKQLQLLCKQKQIWLGQAKQQAKQKTDDKIIQQSIANNLMKMKQIMTKKINNDQYLYLLVNNKSLIEKNKVKLQKLSKQIKVTIEQQIQKMNNSKLQTQLQQIEKEKQKNTKNIQINEQFMSEINQLLKQGYQILAQPLGSNAKTQQLLQICETLNNQINLICKK